MQLSLSFVFCMRLSDVCKDAMGRSSCLSDGPERGFRKKILHEKTDTFAQKKPFLSGLSDKFGKFCAEVGTFSTESADVFPQKSARFCAEAGKSDPLHKLSEGGVRLLPLGNRFPERGKFRRMRLWKKRISFLFERFFRTLAAVRPSVIHRNPFRRPASFGFPCRPCRACLCRI